MKVKNSREKFGKEMAPECSEVRNHALTFTNELNKTDHEKKGYWI
jgi:hypothetical protein